MARRLIRTLRKWSLLDYFHFFLKENAHVNFLFSMVLLVVLAPYLEEYTPGDLGVTLVTTYNVLATLYYIIHDEKHYVLSAFATLIIIVEWAVYFEVGVEFQPEDLRWVDLLDRFGVALIFIWALIKLFRTIFFAREVDLNIILSSISGYLALGLMGAFGFEMLSTIFPADFQLSEGHVMDRHDYVYFSFVTMSTLGYGDVVPSGPLARGGAVLLTLAGQMYMTMVIAVLIGKYLATSREGGKKKKKS